MAHGNGLETTQEDVARKRQKYQLAFEQSRDAIIFFAGERFQDCNPATLAMFRVPDLATFVSIHPGDLSPLYQPDGRISREAAADRIDEALSEGQAFFEWRHRTWDGVDFPTEVLLSRIDTDDGALVQALVRDISEQRRLEDSLRRFAAVLDSTPDIVAMHDGDGAMFYLNATGARLVGLPERSSGDLWGRSELPPETKSLEGTLRWIHPSWAAEKIANEGLPIATKEGSWRGETAVLDREGKEVPVSQVIIVHRDDAGDIHQISTFLQDISERRGLEDQLRREKAISESILAGLPGIFYILDGQGQLVRWNDRVEAVTGRSSEELDGLDALVLIPQEEKKRVAKAIAKVFSEGSTVIESKLCTVEGDTPYLFNGLRIELNGQPYLLGVGLDIARQKQLEVSLEREATTDPLTGLYNRQRFDAEMERALARHARYGTETALVMIDLDHFKKVNDTYGHDVGDRVLVELTKRLAGEMRQPDFLARWGGEEFVALLPETDPSEAARMAERLCRCIEVEPFPEVGGLTISLGITSFRNGDTLNMLLKRVDNALYEAKRTGRNRVVVNGEDSAASAGQVSSFSL
ncbi:sensor domain-containing diguanylate cyclase [Halomonas daqiaonensis]|uniref:PAS domain S-box-containing protein/diguanylate cyclase (GGDEF) domain-containing protein n=1 Tax=Halomonas daqiaonensis TaxID=650850 RepID=A0A1H7TFE6_9GAMM|nr:diguanylate cyclase [Halomonas daqiaonensis]SEL83600.1 PAS domain S-box-containing protein/diguanylate cyclase (GGDEF) domain-containing protein [Halomonas daqiaonensis]